jgi:hypothetical protein
MFIFIWKSSELSEFLMLSLTFKGLLLWQIGERRSVNSYLRPCTGKTKHVLWESSRNDPYMKRNMKEFRKISLISCVFTVFVDGSHHLVYHWATWWMKWDLVFLFACLQGLMDQNPWPLRAWGWNCIVMPHSPENRFL